MRCFLTVDDYSNHFLPGSAKLSFPASVSLPLSPLTVSSSVVLFLYSLASSFPPSHGDVAPVTPGHARGGRLSSARPPGWAATCRAWDPVTSREGESILSIGFGQRHRGLSRPCQKGGLALAGGAAVGALWLTEDLGLRCGEVNVVLLSLSWRGALQRAVCLCGSGVKKGTLPLLSCSCLNAAGT